MTQRELMEKQGTNQAFWLTPPFSRHFLPPKDAHMPFHVVHQSKDSGLGCICKLKPHL